MFMACKDSVACENDWLERGGTEEFAFLQHVESIRQLSNVDELSNCVCACQSMDDKMNHTI